MAVVQRWRQPPSRERARPSRQSQLTLSPSPWRPVSDIVVVLLLGEVERRRERELVDGRRKTSKTLFIYAFLAIDLQHDARVARLKPCPPSGERASRRPLLTPQCRPVGPALRCAPKGSAWGLPEAPAEGHPAIRAHLLTSLTPFRSFRSGSRAGQHRARQRVTADHLLGSRCQAGSVGVGIPSSERRGKLRNCQAQ